MKKFFILILICLASVSLFSCGGECECDSTPTSPIVLDENYSYVFVDWIPAKDAGDWVNGADTVFVGRVVDIDFRMVDFSISTSVSPGEKRDAKLRHAIEIEVVEIYKGEPPSTVKLLVREGVPYYKADEQKALLEEFDMSNVIPIMSSSQTTADMIGNVFLFVCNRVMPDEYAPARPGQYVQSLECICCEDEFGISPEETIKSIGWREWRDFKSAYESGKYAK